MQKIFFQSLGVQLVGNLLVVPGKKAPGVLILHGAGHSHKEKFATIQNALFEKGFTSLAFDFIGVGESGGQFADGSLSVRLQNGKDALEELKKYADPDHLSILGSSMGGFLAPLVALSDPGVLHIVLLAAAAYSPDAEEKKLNEEFTSIIRKPNSWEHSHSFTAFKQFPGRVLILYGEHDTTIPDEIKKHYQAIARDKGEWYTISGAGHNLITLDSSKEEKARESVIMHIIQFLTKSK